MAAKGSYWVYHSLSLKDSRFTDVSGKLAWKVVKMCTPKTAPGLPIFAGDYIKLGRVAFKIRETSTSKLFANNPEAGNSLKSIENTECEGEIASRRGTFLPASTFRQHQNRMLL